MAGVVGVDGWGFCIDQVSQQGASCVLRTLQKRLSSFFVKYAKCDILALYY
ncbi:hypothetical protein DFR42_11530 [Undibacterium pigrum]|uniref:Uncharacterized protein n=1 Tax=Undibacterium pigrum TaxID=401470 RepID=A0A318IT27_9BURK|nr:hypothetical protein DFR42_11530 [Undibacterium pigrum]